MVVLLLWLIALPFASPSPPEPPLSIYDVWEGFTPQTIDPTTVGSSDLATGEVLTDPAFPGLRPFQLHVFTVSGPVDVLQALADDCPADTTCAGELTLSPDSFLIGYGLTLTEPWPDPLPEFTGVNFNIDAGPLDGTFFSGVPTVADCAIAGTLIDGELEPSGALVETDGGQFSQDDSPVRLVKTGNGMLALITSDHPCATASGFQASTFVIDQGSTPTEHAAPANGAPLLPFAPEPIEIAPPPPVTTAVVVTATNAPPPTSAPTPTTAPPPTTGAPASTATTSTLAVPPVTDVATTPATAPSTPGTAVASADTDKDDAATPWGWIGAGAGVAIVAAGTAVAVTRRRRREGESARGTNDWRGSSRYHVEPDPEPPSVIDEVDPP